MTIQPKLEFSKQRHNFRAEFEDVGEVRCMVEDRIKAGVLHCGARKSQQKLKASKLSNSELF